MHPPSIDRLQILFQRDFFKVFRKLDLVKIFKGIVVVPKNAALFVETSVRGRLCPGTEKDHVLIAGVVELIEMILGDDRKLALVDGPA